MPINKHTLQRLLLTISLLLLLASLLPVRPAAAQSSADSLDQLVVDLWPDYDRASLLVLLTGTLPAGTALPAQVTIPLPQGATLNAVARVTVDNAMLSDIDFDESVPGQLTMTLPDRIFRIEYYVPYSAEGEQREFNFTWQSDMAINNLRSSVQQPAAAQGFSVIPAAASVTTGQDDLQYHRLPETAVGAGESFTIQGSYTLSGSQLSVGLIDSSPALDAAPIVPVDSAAGGEEINWQFYLGIGGAVLVVLATAWFVYNQLRPAQRAVKPRPRRRPRAARPKAAAKTTRPAAPAGGVRFCHECGQPADSSDRFCSNCGTKLK